MDAKLNPISSSAAGLPLTGKSVSAQSGNSMETRSKLKDETVQDTLETTDREADGRQPMGSHTTSTESQPPTEQGGILDVEG